MRPLRKGEYDLVNISLIGFDPVTKRSYAECQAAWRRDSDAVLKEWDSLRWWHLRNQFRVRWRTYCLSTRLGTGGMTL